jgi:hypothetical protein
MKRLLALLVALVLAAPAAPPATAEPYAEVYITSADGTRLHAEVFRPETSRKVPVVMVISPYLNGDRFLRYQQFDDLLDNGYAVVQVSLRGFGPSSGCSDFGGEGEQADVKAAVEWAARQQWSTGRVGMWGVSYEAWTQVMALATKPRGLSAVLIQSPLVSLYRGLYMNGAHYGAAWHATTASYGVDDLTSSGPTDPTDATCYAENNVETSNPDPKTAYWKERDLVARARTSRVPVLWSHGFADANTKPDNLTALYPLLRGPKRAWVGQFAHAMPMDKADPHVRDAYVREAFTWLDAYVKRDPAALRRVQRASRAVIQEGGSTWRRDDAWPPRDARFTTFGLRSGSYLDIPDATGSGGAPDGAVHWTFSQRLPYAVHLSGVPRVTLTASAATPAQVVVMVYDVEPEGPARLVTRGAHAFVDGKVSFDLYPQDWRFEPGHRIAVAVQGNDRTWWSPSSAAGPVAVSGVSLAAPVLRYDRRFEPVLWSEGEHPPVAFTVPDETVAAADVTFRLPPRLRRR